MLTPDDKALLSMRADEFQIARAHGSVNDWSQYLEGLTEPLRLAVLTELAVIDLACRWENGEQPTPAEYAERFPELTGSDALAEEFARCRDRAGLSAMATQRSKVVATPAERIPAPKTAVDISPAAESVAEPTAVDDEMKATRTVHAANKPAPPQNTKGGDGLLGVAQNYELIKELGRGAFGEVWLARKMPSGIEKAVKILHQPADQDVAQRELRSLELIKNLRHPYLLATEDFWVANNKLYIVTELADWSLRLRLNKCKAAGLPGIPEDELFTYMRESAEGFDYLHSKMITHRDVKPDNILTINGHAKVADFGLARQHDSSDVAMMSFAGTPAYMAPEVWGSEGGPPSDLYAFAITYLELRQGRTPFKLGKVMEVMQAHMNGEFDFADFISDAERAVLCKALAKEPGDRYPSCKEFVEDLAVALGRAGGVRPLPPLVPRTKPRPKGLVAAIIVAAVTLIVFIVFFMNGKRDDGRSINPAELTVPAGTTAEPNAIFRELADGRKLPEWILKDHNGQSARFRLILPPPGDTTEPFYILQSKVWNSLYGKADAEANLPVVNVTANEAAAFAEQLGGRLPKPAEWDLAAGIADRKDLLSPVKPTGRVHVGKTKPEPTHGDGADRAANQFDLIDMAGNGREWTCAVLPGEGQPLVFVEGPKFVEKQLVVTRGRSFLLRTALTYRELEDEQKLPRTQFADAARPYTSFRVVIAAPR